MEFFKKTMILLLDSAGIGEMPDAAEYGDEGANTIANTAKECGGLNIPNMRRLGLGNIAAIEGVQPEDKPAAHFGRMAAASPGKDTTTGHWEIAGVVLDRPFGIFPHGFPPEIIAEFKAATGLDVIGNKPASGTEIIKELGNEHIRTGKPIVYTSADSVFQVAAHEEFFGLERLYAVCEAARKICDRHNIARVIARPFIGRDGNFTRTYNRHDYSLPPPHDTLLDALVKNGIDVIGIGKIKSIFADRGVSVSIHTEGNRDGLKKTVRAIREVGEGLIFTNLVDFDMLYGHRNDAIGYANALEEVDSFIPAILDAAGDDTLLFITADHGCDPTLKHSTDHTREYVPLIVWHRGIDCGKDLGTRKTFADAGQTIAKNFGLPPLPNGVPIF